MPVMACPTATGGSPDRDTTLALLPVGYADGIFRSLSGKIEVLINGRRRRAVRTDLYGPVRRRSRTGRHRRHRR